MPDALTPFPSSDPSEALALALMERVNALRPGATHEVEGLLAALARARLSPVAEDAMLQATKAATGVSLGALRDTLRQLAGTSAAARADATPPPFPVYSPPRHGAPVMALRDVLDEAAALITRRVTCPPEVAWTVALWSVGTAGVRPGYVPGDEGHAAPGPSIYPRLRLKSGGPGSGKTTLMDTVAMIAVRPFAVDGISASALFRTAERFQPTLLLDEADAWMAGNEDVRGFVNSGHRRAGIIMVNVMQPSAAGGEEWVPTAFRTFAPAVIAGIGGQAATVEDRSIAVTMTRAPGRAADRMRASEMVAFRDHLGPHIAAHADAIAEAMDAGVSDGRMPAELSGRACDNWEPIVALADLAGGEWPSRVDRALAALGMGAAGARALARGEHLLADLREHHRDVIAAKWSARRAERGGATPDNFGAECEATCAPVGMVATSAFRVWLARGDNSSPWASADRGQPATADSIARTLRAFGVRPVAVNRREGARVVKVRGYRVADLAPRWRAHLSRPDPA